MFQIYTNILWYVTNQHAVIKDASCHDKKVEAIPEMWSPFQGYNEIKRKKQKEQRLSATHLKAHYEALMSLCIRPSLPKKPAGSHNGSGVMYSILQYSS